MHGTASEVLHDPVRERISRSRLPVARGDTERGRGSLKGPTKRMTGGWTTTEGNSPVAEVTVQSLVRSRVTT